MKKPHQSSTIMLLAAGASASHRVASCQQLPAGASSFCPAETWTTEVRGDLDNGMPALLTKTTTAAASKLSRTSPGWPSSPFPPLVNIWCPHCFWHTHCCLCPQQGACHCCHPWQGHPPQSTCCCCCHQGAC